jgi:methylthioribose-1-phosphate isomerase
MKIRTIGWAGDGICIIDQTKLPAKLEYRTLRDLRSLWQAIKKLQVRGAPALGAAAALGVYLGIKGSRATNFRTFQKELDAVIRYLASSRPTARNLFWGLEKARECALRHQNKPPRRIKELIFQEAKRIMDEDRASCRRIGDFGERLFRDGDTVLTICNAGALATIDYGTALGVLYRAKERGKRLKVFASETRPLLQGARLTTWELRRAGFDVTLICDNMAAHLMQQGKISKVIAGADRIARNGDTANKIGTFNLAILSRYHKIPFYIAAPASTFDLSLKSGKEIPIEERESEEVTVLLRKIAVAPKGVKAYNPAFDVTPHELITAIITEKGLIRPPYIKNIRRVLAK